VWRHPAGRFGHRARKVFRIAEGKDYAHRREWFYQRLRYLAQYFAIDVLAYAILSNHYHLVLRNRPDQVQKLNDREVVTNWLMICPKSQKQSDGTAKPPTEPEIQVELNKPGRVAELRSRLSNPSWLIRQLSQYMGIRCNAEDELTGHFWESRFGMTRLLDEAAILACLAYVDLNPLRAHMTDSLEGYRHVSIGERLRSLEDEAIDSSSWLAPIAESSESDGQPATEPKGVTVFSTLPLGRYRERQKTAGFLFRRGLIAHSETPGQKVIAPEGVQEYT
jgi:hypothetical protein